MAERIRRRRKGWGVAAVALGVGALVFTAAGCGGGDSADVPDFEAGDFVESAGKNWPTVASRIAAR